MMQISNNNIKKLKRKKILTACIGQCVHVAGTHNFMEIATQLGFECIFLGPATPNSVIIHKLKLLQPDILGLSYRLTPPTLRPILQHFKEEYEKLDKKPQYLLFAGTPEVIRVAKDFDFFDEYFKGGESKYRIISMLRKDFAISEEKAEIPMDLMSRIKWKKPYPVIRAHFGLPNIKDTIKGIKKIANAEVLDIISIAPDQNTQANYFHPKSQSEELSGAGGVPIRTKEDFIKFHKARLTGNYPLLRTYAGTRDFIKLAELYRDTIDNAWAAIPIFWFNQMDGRGPLTLRESIRQHLAAITSGASLKLQW